MGCFPVDYQEEKRPLRTKSVKRPIKVGKRPINEGKRPIKPKVLVGVSVGCLMGCFRAPPPWRKTAPLKRPIKRSMIKKGQEIQHLRHFFAFVCLCACSCFCEDGTQETSSERSSDMPSQNIESSAKCSDVFVLQTLALSFSRPLRAFVNYHAGGILLHDRLLNVFPQERTHHIVPLSDPSKYLR